MVNVYKGDIRKRIGQIYPKNNMLSTMNTSLYKKDAILVEVNENKFIDIDELFSGKTNVLNLYAFKLGDLFVDVRSLKSIRTKESQRIYKK